jgi:hypothetical protein
VRSAGFIGSNEERIKGLQVQAGRAQELEAELAKAKEAELTLLREFERWLAEDKKILVAKYDTEVDELRTAQDAKNEKRNAKVQELIDLWESDYDKYNAELGVWCACDRKIHAGLQGLEDALHGMPLL